ncbi:hypothetical protein EDD21DRAFT_243656, partial [Dissophora ornata]
SLSNFSASFLHSSLNPPRSTIYLFVSHTCRQDLIKHSAAAFIAIFARSGHHSVKPPWYIGPVPTVIYKQERRFVFEVSHYCFAVIEKRSISISRNKDKPRLERKQASGRSEIDMSSRMTPWLRGALTPQTALDLANGYLENAQKAKNSEVALTFCKHAETDLDRIRTSVRKTSVSSSRDEDRALCNEIATTHFELGKLLDGLGCRSKAENSYKNEKKWRGDVQSPGQSFSHSENVALPPASNGSTDSTVDATVNPSVVLAAPTSSRSTIQDRSSRDIATIPSHIFAKDMDQPPDINKLPKVVDPLKNISQLVHCLTLIQHKQSNEETLDQSERDWLKVIKRDTEEQERLKTLAIDVLKEFTHDELKDANTVAEVVCLVPVLEKHRLQKLLQQLFLGIEQSELLNFDLLEGLAQLVQRACPGHLNADDLVKILNLTSERLISTHDQAPDYINQLTLTVSWVLDAMADTKIKGLDRENLHKPLADYLDTLKGGTDPHLVYQAAYASQALL